VRASLIRSCVACLLVGAFCGAAAADPQTKPAQTQPTSRPSDAEMIQLYFPADLEVKVFVEYVSKRLGMNILYDDSVGRQRVTISSPAGIPKDSLLGLLHSVLKMADLAMIDAEQPGWKKIVPGKDLLAVTRGLQDDPKGLALAKSTTAITQIFQLRCVTPASVEQLMKPFLSKPGGAFPSPTGT